MNRIVVEHGTSSSLFSTFFNVIRDSRALGIANNIRPVEQTIGQVPFVSKFYRLLPYEREHMNSYFNLEQYRRETEILGDFFSKFIGDPDKAKGSIVDLIIRDYRGTNKRRAQQYLSDQGHSVYMMMPTKMELQNTVIPAPDDLGILREHPVATLMAIRGRYILSGRLFNGSVYPSVNDLGEMHSLNELDNTGAYQHLSLDRLGEIFG